MIHVPFMVPQRHKKAMKEILEDPVKFFKLLQVQDKYSGAYEAFNLYPEQEQLLQILIKKKKIIVIKPRQIGVSTLLRAFAFWQTYVSVNPIKYGVLSFHDRSAKHLRKMDHNFLNGLPEMLRRPCSIDNTTDMEFDDLSQGS